MAREVLVECLSRVPGEAILLTDGAFAGADTGATAYSLACAIRRIEREMFGGSRDYVIVTGMQSVDGDTAQVPPQIAEELGIDHIAYAKGLVTEPQLAIRRIARRGRRGRPPGPLARPHHRDRLHGPALPLVRSEPARRATPRSTSGTRSRSTPTRRGSASRARGPRSTGSSRRRRTARRPASTSTNPAELIGKIAARYGQAAPGAAVDADEAYDSTGRSRPTAASSGSSPSARATASAPSRSS